GTVMPADGIRYGRVYADPRQHADRDYDRTAVHWSARVAEGLTLRADAARANVDRDELLAGFGWLEDDETVAGYYTDYRDRARQTDYRLQARLEREAGGWQHRSSLGLTRHQRRHRFTGEQGWGNDDPDLASYNPDYFFEVADPDFERVDLEELEGIPRHERQRRLEEGAHAAHVAEGGGWRLGAGLRYTRYRIRQADAAGEDLSERARESGVTGRIGLERRLGAGLHLRATGATGLRPSDEEDEDGDLLETRHSRLVEAGLRWDPAADIGVDLARYRLTERNRPRPLENDPYAYEAVGRMEVWGTEATARWQPDACRFTLAAARTDARNRTDGDPDQGRRAVGVPTASAGFTAGCRLDAPGPLPDELGWRTRWQGHRWADEANTRRIHAHTVHGLTAGWDLTPRQRLELDAVNLTDRDHVRSVTSPSDIYQGPTRRVRLAWSWRP
ncbi:MAG: TonB-dependent siderophore receptor, partial [Thiohalospira sp.]